MSEEGGTNMETLVPSQAIQSKPRNRNRRRRKPKPNKSKEGNEDDKKNESNRHLSSSNSGKKNKNSNPPSQAAGREEKSNATKTKSKPKPKRKKKNKNKYLWRKEVPPNTVDPISLEPLVSMAYPPFALNITPPYSIISEWPIPKLPKEKEGMHICQDGDSLETDKKKRQDQLIQEQWEGLLPISNMTLSEHEGGHQPDAKTQIKAADGGNGNTEEKQQDKQQHFHLFDGKVLAVYLVSTLQFVDPLNRRDLTREEVKNLDAYLTRHRLKKMRVLEAYDRKGVSMSSAGASAQTVDGRLRMRQEEASNLLASLFQDHQTGGQQQSQAPQTSQHSNNRPRRRNVDQQNNRNSRGRGDNAASSDQYSSYQTNQYVQQTDYGDYNQSEFGFDISAHWNDSNGTYADNQGMVIIDDDVNPGLRGGFPPPVSHGSNAHYAETPTWHGHRSRMGVEDNFPSLPSADPSVSETNSNPSQTQQNRPIRSNNKTKTKLKTTSKSLSKIGNFVQKSDPKLLEKQRKARELAFRKAEIASMPYEEAIKRSLEGNHVSTACDVPMSAHNSFPASARVEPTETQLERNRNLAVALDVKPSTLRSGINAGWSRPTNTPIAMDEFGNELNLIQYPDELIIEARERMTELFRLEKKWLSFLKDDKAASCPLKPMDRPLRKFVHTYSDFWHLHTESFDPMPKRYIHCVKLLETRSPRPLLSEAVRTWRGPAPPTIVAKQPSSPPDQAAGEETMSSSREFVQTEERAPLKLEPRTITNIMPPPPGAMFDLQDESNGEIPKSANLPFASQQPAARFAPILAERERIILKLDARTKPLELPKYKPVTTVNTAEMSKDYQRRMNASKEKNRIKEERKKHILAAAFCSDDDDTDSEWECEEALVNSDDDDEC